MLISIQTKSRVKNFELCAETPTLDMQRASDLLLGVSMFAEPISFKIMDRAGSAMNELCSMGIIGKPLWHQHNSDRYEVLNNIEYLKHVGRVDATLMDIVKLAEVGELQALPSFDLYGNQINSISNENSAQGLQIEASRDTTMINAGPIDIVELLMDVVGFVHLQSCLFIYFWF